MKIHEKFTVDEETLAAAAESSDYWQSVQKFYEDVKDKEDTELTDRQLGWLEKIEMGLAEKEGGVKF